MSRRLIESNLKKIDRYLSDHKLRDKPLLIADLLEAKREIEE